MTKIQKRVCAVVLILCLLVSIAGLVAAISVVDMPFMLLYASCVVLNLINLFLLQRR